MKNIYSLYEKKRLLFEEKSRGEDKGRGFILIFLSKLIYDVLFLDLDIFDL